MFYLLRAFFTNTGTSLSNTELSVPVIDSIQQLTVESNYSSV